MVGRYEQSLRATERLAAVAESCGIAFASRYAKINKAAAFIGLRRFALAERLLASLERETRDEPGSYFRSNLAVQRARLYASISDLQRALDVLSLGPVDESSRTARGEFLGWQALLHAANGDLDRSRELSGEARDTSRGLETEALSLMAEAVVARKSGASSATFRLFDRAVATEARDPIVIALRADPDLARAVAASRGQEDLADEAALGLLRRLARGLARPEDPARRQAEGGAEPARAARCTNCSPRA